jgi:uncharacterized protein (DUF362 family)/NAD-dependent dihydropyrimidine dehydrogenase PreA subunit
MKEKVSAVECGSYELEEVYASVAEAIRRIGYAFPEDKTVLIKPNVVTQNRPDQHTVTHYTVVDALCRLLSEKNNRILIGDSSAFYMKGLTARAFETAMLDKVAEKYGARLVPFEEEAIIPVREGVEGKQVNVIYLPKILFEVDMIIDACKLKTHSALRMSGAVKNMFGCMPGGYKQKVHWWVNNDLELADIFLDIVKITKPVLCVMDAVYGLDGGPSALGKPVKVSRILASTNPAALDIAACKILGYEPGNIATLIRAKDRHMIEDYDDIEILGNLEHVKFSKITEGPLTIDYDKDSFMVKHTYTEVKAVHSKDFDSADYKKCIAVCPVNAIKYDEKGKIYVDRDVCISCYHCLTACPANMIKPVPSIINRLGRFAGRAIGITSENKEVEE